MKALFAAVLACALAVPAFAATGWTSVDLVYASADPAAAAKLDRDIGPRIDRIWNTMDAGSRWNESAAGPFGLVKGDATMEHSPQGSGRLRLQVSVTPRAALPSEAASSNALMERLVELLRSDIEATLASLRQFNVAEKRAALREAQSATKAATQHVRQHVAQWGDLETERDVATSRLRDAAADLANTRIERAVTSHRLKAARDAVERAAAAEDIRAKADALAAEIEKTDVPGAGRQRQLADLATLRSLLREAEKRAPPMESARQRVFDMEVELVGLEAREALLEPEVASLRARTSEIATARREAADLERIVDSARGREIELEAELRDAEKVSRGPALVIVRHSTSSR